MHDLRTQAQTNRLRRQRLQLLLALDLQRDFGLALALPAAEDGRRGRVREKVFVAGERGVRALGRDLACRFQL